MKYDLKTTSELYSILGFLTGLQEAMMIQAAYEAIGTALDTPIRQLKDLLKDKEKEQ